MTFDQLVQFYSETDPWFMLTGFGLYLVRRLFIGGEVSGQLVLLLGHGRDPVLPLNHMSGSGCSSYLSASFKFAQNWLFNQKLLPMTLVCLGICLV